MNKIPKTISKRTQNVMKGIEKHLEGSNEVYVDKSINTRVEREISHLGKEKLLADHIKNLSKKANQTNKNKMLFLLVRLYHFNNQVHQSLVKELRNDKKLLSKRIKTKFDRKKAHRDVYKKLLKIAKAHYTVVKKYADHFNRKTKYSKKFIANIVNHKRRAAAIYESLTNVRMRVTLHKVLLRKLDSVYKMLIDSTVDLANEISQTASAIKNNKAKNVNKRTKEIQSLVSDKIDVLKSFAYKYSYNIIHSDYFYDFDNHKMVLITKKV